MFKTIKIKLIILKPFKSETENLGSLNIVVSHDINIIIIISYNVF